MRDVILHGYWNNKTKMDSYLDMINDLSDKVANGDSEFVINHINKNGNNGGYAVYMLNGSLRHGHFDNAKYILMSGCVPIENISDMFNKYSYIGNGNIEVLRFLLNYYKPTTKNNISIQYAILGNRLDLVKFLIDVGIDPSCSCNAPLKLAIFRSQFNIAKLLLKDPRVRAAVTDRTSIINDLWNDIVNDIVKREMACHYLSQFVHVDIGKTIIEYV